MILGLHGRMRAGKNTVAERLRLFTTETVREVSFAAKLKESAAALLDITVDDLERWKVDPHAAVTLHGSPPYGVVASQNVRSFLQRYGTEAHRDVFGSDFWLDAALPYGRYYGDALYVVTDVRFENEAERVRLLGGIVVCVAGPSGDEDAHASEVPLRSYDMAIDNTKRNDGFANLDRQLASLARYLERRLAA